jgi:hypothetical protein
VDELTTINKADEEEVEQEQEHGQEEGKDEEGNGNNDFEAGHMMGSDGENKVDETGNGEPTIAASKRKLPHDSELAID